MQFYKRLNTKYVFISLICLFSQLNFTLQDLPVHCLKHQVLKYLKMNQIDQKNNRLPFMCLAATDTDNLKLI